jgi:hypothetical protein
MNTSLRIAAVSLSAMLSACAGTQQMTSTNPPPAEPLVESEMTRDQLYVAYVERVARRRGIQVMWVNPPQKRVASSTE